MKKTNWLYVPLIFALLGFASSCSSRSQQPATTKSTPQPVLSLAQNTEVTYRTNPELKGFLCKPAGNGPFPVVTYHHGGKEGAIGGAPEETCGALADAGFVGFAPIRRDDLSFEDNLSDVRAAIEY